MSIVNNLQDAIKYYRGYDHQDHALSYLWDSIPLEVKRQFSKLWRRDPSEKYTKLINSVPLDRRESARIAIPLLLKYCNKYKVTNKNHIAYIIATVSYECAFRPVREDRASPRTQPSLYKRQSRYWYTGFYGRGYIQITWKDNYYHLGNRLGYGSQFVENPDMVLDPDIAAHICVVGMKEGLFSVDTRFTPRPRAKLSLYDMPDGSYDFLNARRIVNLMDKAALIKSYAEYYLRFL